MHPRVEISSWDILCRSITNSIACRPTTSGIARAAAVRRPATANALRRLCHRPARRTYERCPRVHGQFPCGILRHRPRRGFALVPGSSHSLAIRQSVAEAKKRLALEADRVLDELSALAFSAIADVYDREGKLIPPHELWRDVAAAVKKVKRRELLGPTDEEPGERKVIGHVVELELHDKVAPLMALGRHFGLFSDKLEVEAGDRLIEVMRAARKRTLERA